MWNAMKCQQKWTKMLVIKYQFEFQEFGSAEVLCESKM